VAEAINQPALGHDLHPRADAGRARADPHQAEIAILKCFEDPANQLSIQRHSDDPSGALHSRVRSLLEAVPPSHGGEPFVYPDFRESAKREGGVMELLGHSSGVKQLHYGAVVVEGRAAAELSHSGEDIFEARAPRSRGFQTFVIEKVAAGILRFGDAVSH
jgi:hypothetical protein